jgi:hypothetical protein
LNNNEAFQINDIRAAADSPEILYRLLKSSFNVRIIVRRASGRRQLLFSISALFPFAKKIFKKFYQKIN